MKLSNYTEGKDNNFNLIRIAAAFAVLVSHSFALSTGDSSAEPRLNVLGMTFGSIAVDIFFVISGLLVSASLLKRRKIIDFVWARVLRIYPALLVVMLLTTFLLGLFFTNRPHLSYLTELQTYIYLIKGSSLIAGVSYSLPGVFETNPGGYAVNGSLWTMPLEIRMYAIVAIFWLLTGIIPHTRRIRAKTFKCAMVCNAIFGGILLVSDYYTNFTDSQFVELFFMFFAGAAFYALKDHITLSHRMFLILLGLLLLSNINRHLFLFAYIFIMPYLVFYIAYIPSGFIRKYNKMGDFSYGTYIGAFPVQQSLAALIPGISAYTLLWSSSIITITFAVLSWNLIEKRALTLKASCSKYTQDIFISLYTNHFSRNRGQ